MDKKDRQVNVRVSEDLLERIKASSKASGRSLTAEFSFQLEKVVPVVADTQIKLRLPAELHNWIKDSSQKSSRSINAEIVERLTDSFPNSRAVASPEISRSPRMKRSGPLPEAEHFFRALETNEREKKPAKKTTGNVVRMKSKR